MQAIKEHLIFSEISVPGGAIYQVLRPFSLCISYIILSNNEALIIDPINDCACFSAFISEKGAHLIAVIDTHMHADHLSAGKELSEEWNIPYFFHPYDALSPFDLVPTPYPFTYLLQDDILKVGSLSLKAHEAPGHTIGNLFLTLDESFLFSGDTLFLKNLARPDLGGHAEKWAHLYYHSLKKITALPETMEVLPSHAASLSECNAQGLIIGVLGEIRKNNGDLQAAEKSEEAFCSHILAHLPPQNPRYQTIKQMNLGLIPKDCTIESGKNVCASSIAE
jgi:glyoxylase-like metal-dependent hydrolase (beta-lactamase superfamily II)